MQLQMTSQLALIGIESTRPLLQPPLVKPQLELQIEKPQLEIHSPRPVLHIDQTQCFADMNKRTPAAFAAYYASQGWSDSFQGIARLAMEGDSLGRIENNYSLIDLAMQDLGETADFNVTAIPKQPPRVWADTYPVEFNFQRGTVKGTLHQNKTEGNFQRGQVNIYIRQQNYLQIDWIDSKVDRIA